MRRLAATWSLPRPQVIYLVSAARGSTSQAPRAASPRRARRSRICSAGGAVSPASSWARTAPVHLPTAVKTKARATTSRGGTATVGIRTDLHGVRRARRVRMSRVRLRGCVGLSGGWAGGSGTSPSRLRRTATRSDCRDFLSHRSVAKNIEFRLRLHARVLYIKSHTSQEIVSISRLRATRLSYPLTAEEVRERACRGHCTPRDTRGRYRKRFRTRACTARIERGLNPLALSPRVSGTRGPRRFYDERLRGAFASQLFSRSAGGPARLDGRVRTAHRRDERSARDVGDVIRDRVGSRGPLRRARASRRSRRVGVANPETPGP